MSISFVGARRLPWENHTFFFRSAIQTRPDRTMRNISKFIAHPFVRGISDDTAFSMHPPGRGFRHIAPIHARDDGTFSLYANCGTSRKYINAFLAPSTVQYATSRNRTARKLMDATLTPGTVGSLVVRTSDNAYYTASVRVVQSPTPDSTYHLQLV